MPSPVRSRGFTLIELVVGMTIFVLIAGAAYGGLRAASRTWEKTNEQARTTNEVRLAFDYLRRQLATAFPLAAPAEGGRWRVWFEGTDDRVVFLVEGSRHVGLSGLYQVVVHHNPDRTPPGVDWVMQRFDETIRVGQISEGALRRALIEDVAEAEFTYYGRHAPDVPPVWSGTWRGTQGLPMLVRLQLRGGAVGDWPALTVRIPVDDLLFHRSETPPSETEPASAG